MLQLLAQSLPTVLLAVGLPAAAAHGASCTAEYEPARVTRSVVPETPPLAEIFRMRGTTLVRVDLSATGSVEAASVEHSSGSEMLDRAALATAKAQAYAPETQDCRPVAGSYAIEVEFAD